MVVGQRRTSLVREAHINYRYPRCRVSVELARNEVSRYDMFVSILVSSLAHSKPSSQRLLGDYVDPTSYTCLEAIEAHQGRLRLMEIFGDSIWCRGNGATWEENTAVQPLELAGLIILSLVTTIRPHLLVEPYLSTRKEICGCLAVREPPARMLSFGHSLLQVERFHVFWVLQICGKRLHPHLLAGLVLSATLGISVLLSVRKISPILLSSFLNFNAIDVDTNSFIVIGGRGWNETSRGQLSNIWKLSTRYFYSATLPQEPDFTIDADPAGFNISYHEFSSSPPAYTHLPTWGSVVGTAVDARKFILREDYGTLYAPAASVDRSKVWGVRYESFYYNPSAAEISFRFHVRADDGVYIQWGSNRSQVLQNSGNVTPYSVHGATDFVSGTTVWHTIVRFVSYSKNLYRYSCCPSWIYILANQSL